MSHLYTVALPWGINLLLSNYFLLTGELISGVFNKQIEALICLCLFHTGALLCMCLTNGGNSVSSGSRTSRTNITDFEIGLKNNLDMSNKTI